MKYGFPKPRKRPNKFIFLLLTLLLAGRVLSYAQTDSTANIPNAVAVKDTTAALNIAAAQNKVKLFFNFDARGTFIQHKHINVFGVNAGITFGEKRNRITAGYYWLGYNAARRLVNWRKMFPNPLNLPITPLPTSVSPTSPTGTPPFEINAGYCPRRWK